MSEGRKELASILQQLKEGLPEEEVELKTIWEANREVLDSMEDESAYPLNSPYSSYVIVPVHLIRRYLRIVGPTAIMVYITMLSYTYGRVNGEKEPEIALSLMHWAELLGITKPSIIEAIRRLEAVGLVRTDASTYRTKVTLIIPTKNKPPRPPKELLDAVPPLSSHHPCFDHIKDWNVSPERPTKDLAYIEAQKLKFKLFGEPKRTDSQFRLTRKQKQKRLKEVLHKMIEEKHKRKISALKRQGRSRPRGRPRKCETEGE